ncbi:ABC transporter permease subunit [Rossellomorea aquimaris]|uniref:ABC transporter permease subunit n=1 Tax=Rossellomorea aquimaris TaxID=189382 RepID=UPI0007D06ECE|nr:ABC transporter permease subunit [Rossellomorea aquimaris]
MKKIIQVVIQFLFSCVGIVLVGALPVLLSGINQRKLQFSQYGQTVKEIVQALFNAGELKYVVIGGQGERELFPYLWDPIVYSLTVLLGALLLACVIALCLTILSMMFSERIRGKLKLVFYTLESIPDLFIILITQIFVIFFFKQTGILLLEIAAVNEQKAFLLPIICLAILPTIQLYRLSMLTFEEEFRKNYVELAFSIGLGRLLVITKHIFRNAIISVFFQSKKTVWFMLSNLFVLELLFNIAGITRFLMSTPQPKIFTVSLLAFFIPIFLFYTLGEWILSRKSNHGEAL